MNHVPKEWMPDAKVTRVVCHWSAGAYKASNLDRTHYHILIEDDGDLVRGYHTIKDNDQTNDGVYAAHTRGLNTGSIGVAVCCMAEAEESPFDGGRFPMTEVQWERMAEVVAELCYRYNISVTDKTVLGHGEVQRNLRIKQNGKWDPLVLPWDPQLPREKVASRFRVKVLSALERLHDPAHQPEHAPATEGTSALPVLAIMNGKALPGAVLFNEGAYLKIASLVSALSWNIATASAKTITLVDDKGLSQALAHILLGDDELAPGLPDAGLQELLAQEGYVSAIEVARACKVPITWDPMSETLTLGTGSVSVDPVPAILTPPPAVAIGVKPGDTLFKIAERHLGNGARWTSLLKEDGTPFNATDASKLEVGQKVYLPVSPKSQAIVVPTPVSATPVDEALIKALIAAASAALQKYALRSIPAILAECEAIGVKDPGQIAYILATSEHESNCGMYMHELGGRAYFQKYEFRKSLGNSEPGDGFRFRGRGFVQLTGRLNYQKWGTKLGLDLISDPEAVADPAIAAKVLVQGMMSGAFTRKRLSDFVQGTTLNFFDARAVINGDKAKNGQKIAAEAQRYLAAYRNVVAKGAPSIMVAARSEDLIAELKPS
jgi:predicted chitinase